MYLPTPCYSFFFNDSATTEIYAYLHTLSLHDARPISAVPADQQGPAAVEAPDPRPRLALRLRRRRRGRGDLHRLPPTQGRSRRAQADPHPQGGRPHGAGELRCPCGTGSRWPSRASPSPASSFWSCCPAPPRTTCPPQTPP